MRTSMLPRHSRGARRHVLQNIPRAVLPPFLVDAARRVARDTQHVTRSLQVLAGRLLVPPRKALTHFFSQGGHSYFTPMVIYNQCLWTRRTRNSPRGSRAGWAPLGSLDVASSPTAPPLVVPRSFGACRPLPRRQSVSGICPYPEQARTETNTPLGDRTAIGRLQRAPGTRSRTLVGVNGQFGGVIANGGAEHTLKAEQASTGFALPRSRSAAQLFPDIVCISRLTHGYACTR